MLRLIEKDNSIPNLSPWQQPSKRGSSEGHQGADTERETVVQQRRIATRRRTSRVFLGLLWVLVQIRQLETAAKQQVQELGLKETKRTARVVSEGSTAWH